MFSFLDIIHKVKAVARSTKVNSLQCEKATPKQARQTSKPPTELGNSIFEDSNLCMIDYKESDDSIEGELGAEMIRCYEEEERAWRVEQAETATRRMKQVEQAIKARNDRVAAAERRRRMENEQVMDTNTAAVSSTQESAFWGQTRGPYSYCT